MNKDSAVDQFERQFSTDTASEARANLRNALAAVVWVVMLILLTVAPAIVIHVWQVLV